ncbi:MAG: dephospho-CoA kinase [Stellaceae bacterium]
MIVLGLTGGIGMGKSTAAAMLRRMKVPVHDADRAVHDLLGPRGGAVAAVVQEFPGVEAGGAIDRAVLGRRVFGDAAALRRLEAILHPLVRDDERRFLRRMCLHRVSLAVLDIPLLFETGGEARVDGVIVVTAPAFLQRRRVLARPGMSATRLAAILARQTPDQVRRRRADFIVPTGLGRAVTFRHLRRIVRLLRSGES